MHIDWWTLGLQSINVLVLIWLLARFLFKPVAKIVAERQQAAAALMADATAAKAAALSAQQAAIAQTASLAQQRGQILEAASAEAAKLKTELNAAAATEAERLRAAAHVEIEAMRHDARLAQDEHATQLALEITAKLLDRLPREARVAGFMDGLLSELAKLPEHTRAQLGGEGGALKLIVPRTLSADELATCRRELTHVLGRELPIQLSVDASLIAGLELEAAHAIVRNSFRGDLIHLKSELLAHDHDPA